MEAPGNKTLDIKEILEILPHRYPFVMIDRILDYEEANYITGIKNVTINEPFFQGHFPGHPIMPAVLIVEAMAQIGGVLLMSGFEDPKGKIVYFSGIDNARFRQPVTPGDQLRFELEMQKLRGTLCKMHGPRGSPTRRNDRIRSISHRRLRDLLRSECRHSCFLDPVRIHSDRKQRTHARHCKRTLPDHESEHSAWLGDVV